jgi:hypothetical protein
MSEIDNSDDGALEFESQFPLNHRITALTFNDAEKMLDVDLDNEDLFSVPAHGIVNLYGGRLLRTVTHVVGGKGGAAGAVLGGLTNVASGKGLKMQDAAASNFRKQQEYQYVIALRIYGMDPIWYFMASSFNFRKALGEDALYATDLNVRALVKKLAAFCTDAERDKFITSTCIGTQAPLPPPLGSLMEFFRQIPNLTYPQA